MLCDSRVDEPSSTPAQQQCGCKRGLGWMAGCQLDGVLVCVDDARPLAPMQLATVLAGTYSNLPAAIQDMRGPMPAQEQEQQRLLNQLNHLLYAHLLKVRTLFTLIVSTAGHQQELGMHCSSSTLGQHKQQLVACAAVTGHAMRTKHTALSTVGPLL